MLRRVLRSLSAAAGDPAPDASLRHVQSADIRVALAESDARYRAIVDTAVDAMVVIDTAGRIQSFNRAAETIFGHAAAEVVGRNVRMLMPEPDRSAHDRYLAQYLRTGVPRIIGIGREVEGLRKNGTRFPLELSIAEWEVAGVRHFTGIMRDITERKAAEAALRRSEALLSAVLDALPVGVIIADAQGRILRDNPVNRELWGIPPETTSWEEYADWVGFWPGTGERIKAEEWGMARALLKGEVVHAELVECQRFGTHERRFYLNNAAPIRDAEGAIIGGVVAELDVTERLAAERALRETQARLEHQAALLDLAQEAILVWELGGGIVYWSLGAARIYGFEREEALGRPSHGLLQTALPMPVSAFEAMLDETGSWSGELTQRVRDGRAIVVESSMAVVREPDGRRIVMETNRDVTERKRAEEGVREERDRARRYLQVAGVMLVVLDGAGRIETINRRGAEILGYADESALLGRDWFEVAVPAAERERVRGTFRQLIAGEIGAPEHYENPVLRSDGSTRMIAWRNAVLRDQGGRIVGTLSSGEDVTEVRAAEALLHRDKAELERRVEERSALLVQAQKMEVIGQLSGGMAHDFNNLLQGIGNCLAVIDRHVPEGTPRTLFTAAEESIRRGARLTQSLLAFARRQVLAPEPTDLSALLDGMRPLLERTLGGLIRISVEVTPGTRPALADPAQLESAILNLAINARDAMPGGGRLQVRAYNAVSGEYGAGDAPSDVVPPGLYVAVAVSDTGSGMDPATLARVFEPFFTTKDVGKGSGLGLSMVQGMASQSGGGVDIASTAGQGTTVTLYLPQADRPPAVATRPPVGRLRGEGRTVLLVDDDDLVRKGAVAVLDMLGYRVLAADSGRAALSLLRADGPVDALVTDYAMPGMSGVALIAEAQRLLPDLPALLITGYADRPAGVERGTILHKPFQVDELAACLAALLQRERPPGMADTHVP